MGMISRNLIFILLAFVMVWALALVSLPDATVEELERHTPPAQDPVRFPLYIDEKGVTHYGSSGFNVIPSNVRPPVEDRLNYRSGQLAPEIGPDVTPPAWVE